MELLWVERGKCEGANILINCIRVECKNGKQVEEKGKQPINSEAFDTEELRRSVIHNYIICRHRLMVKEVDCYRDGIECKQVF